MTNINTMTMEQEIKALREATEGMIVAFSLAWNEHGPDIGVRRSGKVGEHDPREDSVIINGHCWLIAGDIIDAITHKRYDRVADVFLECPKQLLVRVRAQALVYGSMVQVDLGTHKAKFMYMLSPECGQLILE